MDIKKLFIRMEQLTKMIPNEWGRVSILSWAIYKGMPRATVYINGEDKTVTGRANQITATFNYDSINLFIGALETIVDSEPLTKYVIECFNQEWVDNMPTDNVILQTVVTISKSKHGIIFLGFKDGNPESTKPPVIVKMLSGKWHKVYLNDENISALAEASRLYAKSYFEQVKLAFFKEGMLYSEYNDLATKDAAKTNSTTRDMSGPYVSDGESESEFEF